jgi:hypothetical protein
MDIKNLKKKIREPEVLRLLPNLCDLHKKIHRLGYGFKNPKKIYRLAYGFLFFVIPISSSSSKNSFHNYQNIGLSSFKGIVKPQKSWVKSGTIRTIKTSHKIAHVF